MSATAIYTDRSANKSYTIISTTKSNTLRYSIARLSICHWDIHSYSVTKSYPDFSATKNDENSVHTHRDRERETHTHVCVCVYYIYWRTTLKLQCGVTCGVQLSALSVDDRSAPREYALFIRHHQTGIHLEVNWYARIHRAREICVIGVRCNSMRGGSEQNLICWHVKNVRVKLTF